MPDSHLVLRRPWFAVERTNEREEMTHLFDLGDPLPWAKDALCARAGDPEAWFSEQDGTGRANTARAVCARCPVQPQCLRYALDRERVGDHLGGLWGGWSANARLKWVQAERADLPQRPPTRGATA